MKPKYLLKIANFSGWLLLLILIFYFISGYALVHEYGFDQLLHKPSAWKLHKYMAIPLFTALVLHVVPYYIVRKQLKRLILIVLAVIGISAAGAVALDKILMEGKLQHQKQGQTVLNEQPSKCFTTAGGCPVQH